MRTPMLKTLIAALGLVIALLAVGSASASDSQDAAQDQSWQFHSIVDVAFVQAHRTVPMEKDVMIIDARPYKPKYVEGHIPGAVSIPDTHFDDYTQLLPENKDALLIFYCGGFECKLSHKSAKKAEALGYTNVKVFAAGFPAWKKAAGEYPAVSIDIVAAAIENNDTLIVDARPKKPKYDEGHIPTAISIPFSQFNDLSGKLPRDLNTPVIFYCGGLDCRLSHKSAVAAMKLGYTKVSVFDEGYPEWKKVYGASGEKIAIKAGEFEGSMDIEMFKEIEASKPDSITIIDVRDADEFAKGSFKTAVNIPVDTLEDRVNELKDDKPIVFVCSTGARSGESFYMLQDLRPELKEVYYLDAGISFNEDGTYEFKKSEG